MGRKSTGDKTEIDASSDPGDCPNGKFSAVMCSIIANPENPARLRG
jgi:hypothetical protein